MKNELLRHTLATIQYRFDKSVQGSKEEFGDFSLGKGSRSVKEIINHMYHVLNFTRTFLEEGFERQVPKPLDLKKEIQRFNKELKEIDALFSVIELNMEFSKKLLQGPLSDILTHIGQIAMLRRLVDEPIPRENFSAASIKTGLD